MRVQSTIIIIHHLQPADMFDTPSPHADQAHLCRCISRSHTYCKSADWGMKQTDHLCDQKGYPSHCACIIVSSQWTALHTVLVVVLSVISISFISLAAPMDHLDPPLMLIFG